MADEKKIGWIKDLICDELDKSFAVQPGLDPIDIPDGGYPLWLILYQISYYFNEGNRNMNLKVPIYNGVCGRIEVLNEKTDPQMTPFMHGIISRFRESGGKEGK